MNQVNPQTWIAFYETQFKRQYSIEGFVANFGLSVNQCQWLWDQIEREEMELKPKYLLWTLSFLKTYGTMESLSAKFQVSERSYRQWVWDVLDVIDNSLPEVLNFLLSFILSSSPIQLNKQ